MTSQKSVILTVAWLISTKQKYIELKTICESGAFKVTMVKNFVNFVQSLKFLWRPMY